MPTGNDQRLDNLPVDKFSEIETKLGQPLGARLLGIVFELFGLG